MTAKELVFPFYARITFLLVGSFALIAMLYIAQGIVVPIIFAIIIAILLQPVVSFLVRLRINRVVAIAITMLLTFLIIAAIGFLLFTQASRFSESWPLLVDRFTLMLNQSITWVSEYFDIKPQKIHEWIIKTKNEVINTSSAAIGQTLLSVGNTIVVILLVPAYVFMILYYQPLLLDFIRRLFAKKPSKPGE
ncbi:MAG: AI-2E family transporter [Bacteroidales bacterium]